MREIQDEEGVLDHNNSTTEAESSVSQKQFHAAQSNTEYIDGRKNQYVSLNLLK